MDGFLLLDKPSGWTSHDVVAKARGITGIKKIGHAGTLDPLATGLLVLGVGRATRLLRFVQGTPKEYLANAQFGVATESLDADGAVLSREAMDIEESDLATVVPRFVGEILQVAPMVSARKVEGRRLYELAREGKEVVREARPVVIHELEILEFAPSPYPAVAFRVVCSTGTYVRTLADDLARALGGRAHLTALRRTRIGSLDVAAAVTVEALDAAGDGWHRHLRSPREGLADLPEVTVAEDMHKAVANGLAVPLAALGAGSELHGPIRLTDAGGRLMAVYRVTDRSARPEVVIS